MKFPNNCKTQEFNARIFRSPTIQSHSFTVCFRIIREASKTHFRFEPRRWTWTGDFKCREVKTGFCRKRWTQTGSSATLIGWKSGQTTFIPLWDRMEGAWLWTPKRTDRRPTVNLFRLFFCLFLCTRNTKKILVWFFFFGLLRTGFRKKHYCFDLLLCHIIQSP